MFTFPLLAGDPNTALQEQKTVVLTEELARKVFSFKKPTSVTLLNKLIKIRKKIRNPLSLQASQKILPEIRI
jgi:hypothetical protein